MKTLVALFLLAFAGSGALAQNSAPAWRFVGPEGGNITHITSSGDTLFAVGEYGRLFRNVAGRRWEELLTPQDTYSLRGITSRNNTLYTLIPDRGFDGFFTLLRSWNGGETWQQEAISLRTADDRLSSAQVSDVSVVGNWTLILHSRGVLRVTNNTVSVQYRTNAESILFSTTLTCIASTSAIILCGSKDSTLFRSTDSGKTWQNVVIPFVPRSLTFVNALNVIAISTNALWRSVNAGISWQRTCDLPSNIVVQSISNSSRGIFISTTQGVITADVNTCDWRSFNQGLSLCWVNSIVANDSAVFVSLRNLGGYHRWENDKFEQFVLPNGRSPEFLSVTQTQFWAHSGDSIVWRSPNGKEWRQIKPVSNTSATMSCITGQFGDGELFANIGVGILFSDDFGQNWRPLSATSNNIGSFSTMAAIRDTLWAAGWSRIACTVNKGQKWQSYLQSNGSTSSVITRLWAHENTFYAQGGSCFIDCQNWAVELAELDVYKNGRLGFVYVPGIDWSFFAPRKRELIRVNFRRSCFVEYKSVNADWKRFPAFPNVAVNTFSLGANNKNVFVGTNGGLYVLNAVSTSVSQNIETLPSENKAKLHSFPNPTFGDVAFKISLPRRTTLRLSIFDALGQEVARLTDGGEYEAGEQEFVWSPAGVAAKNVSQGVYIARLQAGTTVTTTKILLVR